MARSVSGGAPPRQGRFAFPSEMASGHPCASEPLHPLRPETKGQAGACPDQTRAIPCKVQQSSSEDRRRARCVPDRTVIPGTSRTLRDKPPPELTCGYEACGSCAHVLLSSRSRVRIALLGTLLVRPGVVTLLEHPHLRGHIY